MGGGGGVYILPARVRSFFYLTGGWGGDGERRC